MMYVCDLAYGHVQHGAWQVQFDVKGVIANTVAVEMLTIAPIESVLREGRWQPVRLNNLETLDGWMDGWMQLKVSSLYSTKH